MKFTNPSKFKKFITAFLTFAICIGAAFSGVYADTPKKVSEQNREKMNEIDRITPEQADEMALELTNRIWVWEWVEFFIPYMSEDGVKQIIPASASSEWVGMLNYSTMSPMEPFTQAQLDNARNRKSEKAYLTKTDINNHALMIMESNGRWDCVDFMLPYMTENGINQVLNLYAGKHGVQMPIAENPSNNANNVTNVDAEALEIMQNTGNWSYIEPYLPQMTNTGIDAVVNCYNSKHFNPNEFKKASDYYN